MQLTPPQRSLCVIGRLACQVLFLLEYAAGTSLDDRREKDAVITIPQRILFKDGVLWHVPIIIIIIIIIILSLFIIIIIIIIIIVI